MLYCTGARPSEVAGDYARGLKGMTWGDIIVDVEKGEMLFEVPISKVKDGIYAIEKRPLVLEFDPTYPDMAIDIIIGALISEEKKQERQGLEFNQKKPLFRMCRKTGYNIVQRAGKVIGTEICPYNFRHSRLTQLAEQGAGIETLMYFKGSRDIKSIEPYLHAKEVRFKLSREREERTGY